MEEIRQQQDKEEAGNGHVTGVVVARHRGSCGVEILRKKYKILWKTSIRRQCQET